MSSSKYSVFICNLCRATVSDRLEDSPRAPIPDTWASLMKRFFNLRLLLVALLLGGPIVACAAPAAQLTADEKQCCRDMAGECGRHASGMPMSHSCCKTAVNPPDDFRPSNPPSATPLLIVSAVELPSALRFAQQPTQCGSWQSQAPSPPLESLDASAPLRI
jgi:hypothetical protein